VQWTLTQGGDRLYLAVSDAYGVQNFLADYGFAASGTTEDGRTIYEKNIRFIPEFLGD